MKPMELAANLTEIVARHTQSQAVWRREPITHEEMLAIGAELERYLRGLHREWQKATEARDIT